MECQDTGFSPKEVKMACDYVYVGYVNIFRHDNKLQGKKTGPVLKSTYYHCKKITSSDNILNIVKFIYVFLL